MGGSSPLCEYLMGLPQLLSSLTPASQRGELYVRLPLLGCLHEAWRVFSLTERTEFTEHLGACFELIEGLRHTEFTEAFQLTLAVTLCDIG